MYNEMHLEVFSAKLTLTEHNFITIFLVHPEYYPFGLSRGQFTTNSLLTFGDFEEVFANLHLGVNRQYGKHWCHGVILHS